ncbi:DUF2341 domain-containing protein, partial [archaeon]|nr:DUF2341 domain-containing protein [archaeon]
MLTKYADDKAIIVIGTFLILSVFAFQLSGIQNYRDILDEYPQYDLILLTNDTVDRLELLGRSYSEHEEFYRWSFKDGKVKTYIASDLIDTSYWQLFKGTKQIYYNEKSPLEYTYTANSANIIIGIDYFLDSRHTNYVGRLEREIEIYPNKNKETIKWYPKNKTIKYNFQWVHETDHIGESKNLKEEHKTDLDKLQINWNDSIEQVSAARQYLNGKVKVRYISAYGDQVIDPIVKIGGTTVTYDRYDGLGGVSYTPECFPGEVCHLPLSITLSKNYILTENTHLTKKFKNKHGLDIELPTSGINIWGDVNRTIKNWTNETCTDYSEYLYNEGNETWYWNNGTNCIGGYYEEINETIQAWKPLELPLAFEKDVPVYIDIYGVKNDTEAVDALGVILGYTTYEFAWWNSSWAYKKEIQIDGTGLEIPANYQFKIDVDYVADKMNSTFKDLRFTNGSEIDAGLLDYWVETNISETSATVWVEIPETSNTTNTTVYMYYGNPTATSES